MNPFEFDPNRTPQPRRRSRYGADVPARAAQRAVEGSYEAAGGAWDGPIPTNDNFHDVWDGNMVVHDALRSEVGEDWDPFDDDEGSALFDQTYDALLKHPMVDAKAPPERVDQFYQQVWGRPRQ